MSTELITLLQRIQGRTERFAPPTEEPPKPSKEIKVLLLRLETREWQAHAELELIELLRDMEYEIRFIRHALNCKNCLLELCLDVERYLGSHSGFWYLDLQNDPEYFMEIHPDAPDPRKYKFGSYWTRDEGQAIPFIKDRMRWAQNITKKQLRVADKLLEVVQGWDLSAKAYERYEDLWNQLNVYVSTPPLFWGEKFVCTIRRGTRRHDVYVWLLQKSTK